MMSRSCDAVDGKRILKLIGVESRNRDVSRRDESAIPRKMTTFSRRTSHVYYCTVQYYITEVVSRVSEESENNENRNQAIAAKLILINSGKFQADGESLGILPITFYS